MTQPQARTSVASGVDAAIAACLIAVGLALRVPLLGQGLWRDEASTYFDAASDLSHLWDNVRLHEWTPPLYFFFIHFWMRLAGTSETALRSPSLLFSLAAIGVVYAAALRLSGRVAAGVAATLAAISPLAVSVGIEARAYGLAMLLSAWTLYAYVAVTRAQTSHGRRNWTIVFGLAAALLACTHFTGYIVLAALGMATLVRTLVRRGDDAGRLLVAAVIAAFLITLPLAGLLAHDAGQQVTWQDRHETRILPAVDEHLNAFGPFGAMRVQFDRLIEIGTLVWLAVLASRFAKPDESRSEAPRTATLLAFGFVVAAGIAVGIARSLPMERHLMVYAPFAWVFIAGLFSVFWHWIRSPAPGLSAKAARIAALLPIAYVVAGGLLAYPHSYWAIRRPVSGSQALVATLERTVRGPVLLVACPDYLGPTLAYYTRGSNDRVRGVVTWKQPWFYSVDPAPWRTPGIVDRLLARIERTARRQHASVALAVDWSVTSYNGIDYRKAHELARREIRSHDVLRRRFAGTREPLELIVLRSARPRTRVAAHT